MHYGITNNLTKKQFSVLQPNFHLGVVSTTDRVTYVSVNRQLGLLWMPEKRQDNVGQVSSVCSQSSMSGMHAL